jgi:hypothetical protein
MPDLFPVTLDEMVREVEREITLRRRVYPRAVASKRMSQDKADKQIAIMEAVSPASCRSHEASHDPAG